MIQTVSNLLKYSQVPALSMLRSRIVNIYIDFALFICVWKLLSSILIVIINYYSLSYNLTQNIVSIWLRNFQFSEMVFHRIRLKAYFTSDTSTSADPFELVFFFKEWTQLMFRISFSDFSFTFICHSSSVRELVFFKW